MAVVAGFFQSVQVAQTGARPKLSGTFTATLARPARRLCGPTTDGPALFGDGPIVQATGLGGKIVLFPLDHFPRCATPTRQPRICRRTTFSFP